MITTVELQNFRKHQRLRCELSETHWLVGPNGSGKTAVLEAIDLATSTGSITSRIGESDFHNADSGPISVRVTFDRYFMVGSARRIYSSTYSSRRLRTADKTP